MKRRNHNIIGRLRFQAGYRRRRLNLALFFVYFVLLYTFILIGECVFVVFGLVFPYQAK